MRMGKRQGSLGEGETRMRFFDFFKIIYDEVFIAQLLAVSFSAVWIFYDWKKEKRNILMGIVQIVGVFAVGTVLNWFLFALSTVWHALGGICFHISWLITIVVYLGLFVKCPAVNKIVMGATVFIAIISTSDFGHQVVMLLKSSFGARYFDYICLICDMLMVMFCLYLRKHSLKRYSDIPPASAVLIMINAFVSVALIVGKTIYMISAGNAHDAYYCFVLLGIFIVSVASYMMLYYYCKAHKENTDLTVQVKLLEADKQMLIVSEQAIEEMRALRHDMKNQNKVMRLMLEEKRYDELGKYFASYSEQLNRRKGIEFIDSGNRLIDSIINMEKLKCSSYGVELISKTVVAPQLPFDDSDLCSVIVNLIDNAIEGVLRTENKNYMIDVKIGRRSDYFYIGVQNVVRGDIDSAELLKLETFKPDAKNHGYGHKIVKKIVEKYNGCVNYSVVDGEFIAEVMLDMKAQSALSSDNQ